MNTKIIEEFQRLVDYHKSQGTNSFKIRSFIKAINILKTIEFEIISGEQLDKYPGIGKGTINRIDEIINSGNLSEIKDTNKDLNDLITLTGIGPSTASKLLTNGITLEKLRNNQELANKTLTHHQLIGLKYYDDINQRIPYSEIQSIEKYIKKKLKIIDPNVSFKICGSFRRKKPESGDIDILIYYDNVVYENPYILKKLVSELTKVKFLVDHLTELGSTKYMGMCKLNEECLNRRIDIRFIHNKNVPFALLYFTGSGEFNKNMRIYANKLGYKLNEYNIENIREPTQGPIYCNNERDIFRFFKLKYVKPEDRVPNYLFESQT